MDAVIAYFRERGHAEQALDALVGAGVSRAQIGILPQAASDPGMIAIIVEVGEAAITRERVVCLLERNGAAGIEEQSTERFREPGVDGENPTDVLAGTALRRTPD